MITAEEESTIEDHAYVPEHLPQYVTPISGAEPFLLDDFLAYRKKNRLVFIGYPLREAFDEEHMQGTLEGAIRRFEPEEVALTAPSIPSSIAGSVHPPSDHYYRLDLGSVSVSQKVRNMLNRAGRELTVERGRSFDEEHRRMVDDFLKLHPVEEATRFIFKRIGEYIASSSTAWLFDARNGEGRLVAFDIAEFKPKNDGIYMFNFSSPALYIPGASDLLLAELIRHGKAEGKNYMNLGLGINPGVTFFKKKWGGETFLPYTFYLYRPGKRETLEALFQKL